MYDGIDVTYYRDADAEGHADGQQCLMAPDALATLATHERLAHIAVLMREALMMRLPRFDFGWRGHAMTAFRRARHHGRDALPPSLMILLLQQPRVRPRHGLEQHRPIEPLLAPPY